MSQMIIYKILTNNINHDATYIYINHSLPMLDEIMYARHSGPIGLEASRIKFAGIGIVFSCVATNLE